MSEPTQAARELRAAILCAVAWIAVAIAGSIVAVDLAPGVVLCGAFVVAIGAVTTLGAFVLALEGAIKRRRGRREPEV